MSQEDHVPGDAPRPRADDTHPTPMEDRRRPGETVFAGVLTLASLVLLWQAYGIAGFEALSSPGAIPMATTLAMAVTAGIVLWRTLRLPVAKSMSVARDILPGFVLLAVAMLTAYALLLRPLGFLPTSALFLIVLTRVLSGRSLLFSVVVSLGALFFIWIVFRIVFSVLMPPGVVPEAELVQMLRDLVSGGGR